MKTMPLLLLMLTLPALAQIQDRVFLNSTRSWTNASEAIKAAERLCNSTAIPDKASGRQLMLELARAGRVEASLNLWSEDMPIELARELLTPHAQKGNIQAMLKLASTLRRVGYPKEVVYWYRRAADCGDKVGKYALANAYVDGYGGTRDWITAAKLFEELESFTLRADLESDGSIEHYKWIRVAQLRGQDIGSRAKELAAYPKAIVDAGERQALEYVSRRYPAARR
jgi:TPR repeat protein